MANAVLALMGIGPTNPLFSPDAPVRDNAVRA